MQEDCPVPESLHLAQQEIWRLQDAVKTLEVNYECTAEIKLTCLQSNSNEHGPNAGYSVASACKHIWKIVALRCNFFAFDYRESFTWEQYAGLLAYLLILKVYTVKVRHIYPRLVSVGLFAKETSRHHCCLENRGRESSSWRQET